MWFTRFLEPLLFWISLFCKRIDLYKYEINQVQYMQLKSHVKAIMKPDRNSLAQGFYKIQSIYFDNIYDKAVQEKVSGISKREKFRIRYYNDNFSYIVLEKKVKNNNLCKKFSARITEEECRNILNGNIGFMAEHKAEMVRELYRKMTYDLQYLHRQIPQLK